MDWIELTIHTTTAGADIVSEALMAEGATGTMVEDRADIPDPDKPNGYWEIIDPNLISSMPEDVQLAFYRTIAGLENIRITRPAYAIEYDCIDPQDLKLNLEYRDIENLFCAGQFNGSSGYEEAASQGLMAGINAVLKISGKNPFVLGRDEAYIGVLIDDLVTKGTNEPYRIMTSRAEYRLVLRQDNADQRLTEKSYSIGLASEARYQRYLAKKAAVEAEMQRLSEKTVGRYDLHYLCGCPSWNGYGAGVQKGGRTGRDSGQTLLYVRTYKRRPKTTDGTCKAVLIFTA